MHWSTPNWRSCSARIRPQFCLMLRQVVRHFLEKKKSILLSSVCAHFIAYKYVIKFLLSVCIYIYIYIYIYMPSLMVGFRVYPLTLRTSCRVIWTVLAKSAVLNEKNFVFKLGDVCRVKTTPSYLDAAYKSHNIVLHLDWGGCVLIQ